MATATRWNVDDETRVELDLLNGDINIWQGSGDPVTMAHTGTSCAELIDALLAACIESGRDLPDLTNVRNPSESDIRESVMSKTAPRRIWIDAERTYSATSFSAGIEYIRADLHEAEVAILKASNARLVEALNGVVGCDHHNIYDGPPPRYVQIARAALQENDHE